MEYICEQRLVLTSNVKLRLTDEQLRRRRRQVIEVGRGVYAPIVEVEFKAGETIEVEGPLPKIVLASVRAVGTAPAADKAPPKSEAKATAPARKMR